MPLYRRYPCDGPLHERGGARYDPPSRPSSEVVPRSTRLKPSSIDPQHPIVRAGLALGRTTYGSPTTSDQALLDIPSLKLGVGDSARSHSADEFVGLSEIREGIELYIRMLDAVIAPQPTR